MITNIRVITDNLKLDNYAVKFDYTVYWNNKFKTKGTYEESHDIEPEFIKEFEKDLKKQGMVMLALEQVR